MPLAEPGLVSTIVCFLNADRFIGEAIESVIAQTYPRWELLLVDDGSSDRSAEIVQRYAARFPDQIKYLQHPGGANRGMPASRNVGLRHASGEFAAILDADDVWLPRKLEEQTAILRAHSTAGMVYGAPLYWFSWTGRRIDRFRDCVPELPAPPDTLVLRRRLTTLSYPLGRGLAPCPCDLMIRTDLLRSVGGFQEEFTGSLQLYEDQVFLAKLYLETDVFVSSKTWSQYRQHPDSCVRTVRKAGEYERVRAHFLRWLADYLEEKQIHDSQIDKALDEAFWWVRRPLLYKARQWSERVYNYFKPQYRSAEPQQITLSS